MKQRKEKFSIRKLAVGASSVVVASLLFFGGSAYAAQEDQSQGNHSAGETSQSNGEQQHASDEATQSETSQSTEPNDNEQGSEDSKQPQSNSLHTPTNEEMSQDTDDSSQSKPSNNATERENQNTQNSEANDSQENTSSSNDTSKSTQQNRNTSDSPSTNDNENKEISSSADEDGKDKPSTSEQQTTNDTESLAHNHENNNTPVNNDVDQKEHVQTSSDRTSGDEGNDGSSEVNTNDKPSTKDQDVNSNDKQSTEGQDAKSDNNSKGDDPYIDPEFNRSPYDKNQTQSKNNKASRENKTGEDSSRDEAQKDNTLTQDASDEVPTREVDNKSENNNVEAKKESNSQPSDVDPEFSVVNSKDLRKAKTSDDKDEDRDKQKGLKTLKNNSEATTTNKEEQARDASKVEKQLNKKADQQHYKNKEPIVLVSGFNGFTDDIKPEVLTHYWGGDKANITQDLEQNGYKTFEASISAFGSNYDRAVELYYYLKGGTVDYGAAHAARTGHARYGKTYEGVYKDWKPGKKVHLVGHSMGGQTVRQLEELLRNGSQEEIDYQKKHGGEISPLYTGKNDNMVSSITTIATPHNGTHASDLLGNEALVRQIAYDYAKFQGNKDSSVDLGLGQWGLKQKKNESLVQYLKRVKKNDQLWKSKDNALYDLSREGADRLNQHTSVNPNIYYKTYTGEATHKSLTGRYKSDLNMFIPMTITGNVIGKAKEEEWRLNDGLVSTISALHPFNQAHEKATKKNKKGVWQVTPIKHGWDHADFVGQDYADTNRTSSELLDFYHQIAEDLVRTEE
ncbi:YSIRK-type signal peptide-containing protein [Staphylococcus sp. SQ8-PEA]|uniref:triacylglycerol lipase n=1 Tax=Staphylococcus marylandisciuri TaxID=2981529 RepID=A0ABT2QSR2_9STAP|nr:YSIRK-type signal peptide-containing protein [Staphylococcus marylandisciuri]MCU5747010.1 YSIRK-type signal peptide-containing protein [Staphylococcus marylandisciuri]